MMLMFDRGSRKSLNCVDCLVSLASENFNLPASGFQKAANRHCKPQCACLAVLPSATCRTLPHPSLDRPVMGFGAIGSPA
jgi:hypothetical protein